MTSTPSLVREDFTSSALTPEGRLNFCSNTRVLTPPTSWISCLAVIIMVFPSTLTSRSSGLMMIMIIKGIKICDQCDDVRDGMG